jgi:hypothetical protein
MGKNVKPPKTDFVSRSVFEEKIDSLESYNKKKFFSYAAGKKLEQRIDSIANQGIYVPVNKTEKIVDTDLNLYVFLIIMIVLSGLTFYFFSVIQTLKKTIKHLSRSINKHDGNERPKPQAPSPDIHNNIFREFHNKLEELKSEIDLIKNQSSKSENDLQLNQEITRELPSFPIEPKKANQQIKFFEPTVLHRSAAGLSVFEAYEEVRVYEVFQLNVNPDGKTGTFFFDESLDRGKNDVATELRKLFPFAEYEGSGSRMNFKTTKKGIARFVSDNKWEVVEKAKIEIS